MASSRNLVVRRRGKQFLCVICLDNGCVLVKFQRLKRCSWATLGLSVREMKVRGESKVDKSERREGNEDLSRTQT